MCAHHACARLGQWGPSVIAVPTPQTWSLNLVLSYILSLFNFSDSTALPKQPGRGSRVSVLIVSCHHALPGFGVRLDRVWVVAGPGLSCLTRSHQLQ